MTDLGIGIDVGGSKVLAVVVDRTGTVYAQREAASPGSPTGLTDRLSQLVAEIGAAALDRGTVVSLGVALPGIVDQTGRLRAAPNLGAVDVDIDLGALLTDPLLEELARLDHGSPAGRTGPGRAFPTETTATGSAAGEPAVVFDNDSTCAALAEALSGAGSGHGDVLVVSFGTGIGAGSVVNGHLVRGAHGYAGEVGHMVIDPSGRPCRCGRSGCWEQYASGPALGRLARRSARAGRFAAPKGIEALRGEDVVEAARRNDPEAVALIDEFAGAVAIGLVNLVEVLDPGIIVLGGGLMEGADVLLDPIRTAFSARCRPALSRSGSELLAGGLGPAAAALGAAFLGLQVGRPPEENPSITAPFPMR